MAGYHSKSSPMYPDLSQAVTLPFSGRISSNVFLKAPMQELLATYDDSDNLERGRPTPELIKLYEEWGNGGYGLIITGNVMINRKHMASPGDMVIDPENPKDWVEGYAQVAIAAKAHGALLLAQVNHPGRQANASVNPNFESASDVPLPGTTHIPTPLTIDGISDIVERHAYAAEVLYKAGFDGIHLHAAHGYLFTQFLSPRTNLRTDEYGGSLENRSRIIFESISAIRERVPDPNFIVGIKLNTADFAEGGFSSEDSQSLAVMLEQKGHLDIIELSGGTYEAIPWLGGEKTESTKKREAFFLDYATQLRPRLQKTKLAVTGGFRSASAMEDAVSQKQADFIGLGRPTTAEPHIAKGILSGSSTGARSSVVPSKLGVAASYHQIEQIGRGQRIWDYSQQDDVDLFLKTLEPVVN